MEHIIKKLDSNLLQSWGFEYDGYYWVHGNYPFKLLTANQPNTYMVEIENAPIGQAPPPVETNSQLIQLILAFAEPYIQNKLNNQKFINQQVQSEVIAKVISDYLQFDQNIRMRLIVGAMGQGGLSPDNEYTNTLLSGIEFEFKITLKDNEGNQVIETIYYNPECISYNFLFNEFNKLEIIKVEIKQNDEWYPFFGCGLPKYTN